MPSHLGIHHRLQHLLKPGHCGGPGLPVGPAHPLSLRGRAVQAFKEGRHEEALRHLRGALDASSLPRNRAEANELEKELSHMLSAVAVSKVNDAGQNPGIETLTEAALMLAEASRLDSSNEHARTNLEILGRIISR